LHKASLTIDGNCPKQNGQLPLSYFYPEGGIGFKANRAFPPGSKIVALLYMDDEVIDIEGIISWVFPVLPEIISTMGIKFSVVGRFEFSLEQVKLETYRIG
jgi:hypothetical protein